MCFRAACLLVVAASLVFAAPAWAVNPAVWNISETVDPSTPGGISWTSPTPIDLGLDLYQYAYEITRLEADAGLFGTIDLDELLDVPLVDSGETTELPVVLLDEHVMETIDLIVTEVTVAADVFIEIDDQGFGQLRATNIDVPSIVESLTVEGTVSIEGFAAPVPGDYDGDGVVGPGDYERWRSTYGSTEDLSADGVQDFVIDARDYVFWRDQLGPQGSASGAAPAPEPAAASLLLAAWVLAGARRRV